MRKITGIIIHCSATRAGQEVTVKQITDWHVKAGFGGIGYHYVIALDGKIQFTKPLELVGAHVKGFNANTIGVCYIGGLDAAGKAADTRTPAQKYALLELLRELKTEFPNVTIKGHRDYSPDLNHNGKIESNERVKECPCFDAIPEYQSL